MTDWQLLREYVDKKSNRAFEELVRRHIALVFSACHRQVGDRHLAEDVAQAVFVILAQKAHMIREGTVLAGWLYRAARFASSNARKMEKRRRQREARAAAEAPQVASASAWEELAPVLDAALAGLSDRDRDAVLLKYFQGLSVREVGAALGVSEDAAEKRISRALEKLRRALAGRGVMLGAASLAGLISANAVGAAPPALAASAAAGGTGVSAAIAAETLRGLAMLRQMAVAGGTAAGVLLLIVPCLLLLWWDRDGPAAAAHGVPGVAAQDASSRGVAPAAAKAPLALPVALMPDGVTALFNGQDSLVLTDMQTGEPLRRFVGHGRLATALAVSRDGRLAASHVAEDDFVILWEIDTGREIGRIAKPQPRAAQGMETLRFHPDGRHLLIAGKHVAEAGAGGPTIWAVLMSIDSGAPVRRFVADEPHAAAHVDAWPSFSFDGRRVLLLGAAAHVWDTDTGELVGHFTNSDASSGSSFTDACLSADGSRLTVARGVLPGMAPPAGLEGDVLLYELGTSRPIRRIVAHPGGCTAVGFIPNDGRLLTGGLDGTTRMWHPDTGLRIHQEKQETAPIRNLQFSPDGRHALTSAGGSIRMWRIDPPEPGAQ